MRTLVTALLGLWICSACSGDLTESDAPLDHQDPHGAGADGSVADPDAGPPPPSDAATPVEVDGSLTEVDCTLTIQLVDYALSPDVARAPHGHIVLCAENVGRAPHDLALRTPAGGELARTPTLSPGQRAHLSLDLEAGTYATFCSLPGHESLGMVGTLLAE